MAGSRCLHLEATVCGAAAVVPPTPEPVSEDAPAPATSDTFSASAQLTLFGFDATTATVRIRPRARSWRLWGAVRTQAVGLVLAPVAGLVPPHAPWALGAVGVGFLLARRRWRHHFTLEEVRGRCPRCGAAVAPRAGMMLREPHPVPCDGCHHELALVLAAGVLEDKGSG